MCHRVMGSNVWETSCAFGAHFGVPHSPLHLAALQPCSQRSPPCRGALCWAPPRLSPPPLPAPVVTLPTARSPSAWGSAASAGSTPTSTPRGCCACGPAWSSRHGSDGVSPPTPPPCHSPSSSPLSPSLLPTVLYSPRGSPPNVLSHCSVPWRAARLWDLLFFLEQRAAPQAHRAGVVAGEECSAQRAASCLQAIAFLALLVPFPTPTSPLSSHPSTKHSTPFHLWERHIARPHTSHPKTQQGRKALGGTPDTGTPFDGCFPSTEAG